MNKAKLIEAHKLAIKAHEMAIEAISEESTLAVNAEPIEESKEVAKKGVVKKTVAKKEAEAEVNETAEVEENTSDVTADDVAKMSYNELKKFAQSLGIKAIGTRDQIRGKVLNAIGGGAVEADEEEEVKEEPKKTPKKPSNIVSMEEKKGGLKKKKEAVEEEAEDAEEEMDEIEKSVRAEAEDMDVTEIAELLQSVGVKASGNKAKLTNALVKAVKDGKLDFSDDEEAEDADEEEVVEEADEEEIEFDPHEYHAEYDFNGVNDPSSMSKKRAKAIQKMIDKEYASIESGETSDKDVKDFLETILTEDELEEHPLADLDDVGLLSLYFEVLKSMIDADGNTHEPADPYELNDTNFCCGHELQYDEETEQYICESCGSTYEAD